MSHQIKFVVYRDKSGKYRWRLVAGNGETVAGSEAYSSRSVAVNSANRIKITAHTALIVNDSDNAELL